MIKKLLSLATGLLLVLATSSPTHSSPVAQSTCLKCAVIYNAGCEAYFFYCKLVPYGSYDCFLGMYMEPNCGFMACFDRPGTCP